MLPDRQQTISFAGPLPIAAMKCCWKGAADANLRRSVAHGCGRPGPVMPAPGVHYGAACRNTSDQTVPGGDDSSLAANGGNLRRYGGVGGIPSPSYIKEEQRVFYIV